MKLFATLRLVVIIAIVASTAAITFIPWLHWTLVPIAAVSIFCLAFAVLWFFFLGFYFLAKDRRR